MPPVAAPVRFEPRELLGRVTLADGAWATELRARGFPAHRPAELACIERPDLVRALAREYLDAGARILTTNSFAANALALRQRGVQADVEKLNASAAELAIQACAGLRDAVVVGSIGPTGCIMALREVSEAQVAEAVARQAAVLAGAGVQALVLETFTELAEILLALRAVREVCPLPVIASMSFDSGPQRTRTIMGDEAGSCAEQLEAAGADVIGCNCGAGIAQALPAVVALRAHTSRPLWVKPSAGLPELEHGRPVYRQSPTEFAAHAATLVRAGANVLGGCCGVGPQHIRHLASVLRSQPPVARARRGGSQAGRRR